MNGKKSTLSRGAWLLTHKTLLVKLLAEQFRPMGVKVNAFFPGIVKSDLMPATKNVKNEAVTGVLNKVTSQDLSEITGGFFETQGQQVRLASKYTVQRAQRVLAKYLN